MKKFLALLLSLVMVLALVACGDKKDDTNTDDQDNNEVTDFKVGFIMLHDENSTYDLNFINAAKEASEKLGVEYTIVTNVPEGQECYDKAAELADAGCNIIFADSFGHEDYMIQAAKDFPTCSSATPPAPRRTPRVLPTTTTPSLPSMRAVTSPVSLPV